MKEAFNNFLTSGYEFAGKDNLQRFRFAMLNSLLVIAVIFSFINYFAFIFGFIVFTPIYAKAVLAFALVCLTLIYLLRIKKEFYFLSVIIVLVSALSLFFFALVTAINDEFRLIWFFLTLFVGFILLGKRYGLFLMLLIIVGIFSVETGMGLGLSKLALFTFFNSFIIFTAFAYFFLQKIERDSLEFKLLNEKLEDKVTEEMKQREEQEQMLLRQCRMANMGEMLDSIAHQWRQPLMHINSILMNMDNALEVKETKKDYLGNKIDEVASLTTHMSQTIEDFRNLFKSEKEKTCFTLETAIDDVLVLMKNGFNNVEVIYNSEGNTFLFGHKSELIQVIIILLSNAVEVLNKRDIDHKKITIKSHVSKQEVEITIEDNAGGIKADNTNVIFDPYFTTKEQSGGTGLGLYIAKIIVKHKMAGKITASNTEIGAKFTLNLSKDNKED
jgi:signal transduction histidine kinase